MCVIECVRERELEGEKNEVLRDQIRNRQSIAEIPSAQGEETSPHQTDTQTQLTLFTEI